MSQTLFASNTAPTLSLLDANFTELYNLINLVGGAGVKVIGGIPTLSFTQPYSYTANYAQGFVDSTLATNNRICEWLWSAGSLQGRFVNDTYTAANAWVVVSGGVASGVTSIKFGGPVSPASDNITPLGSASLRWSTVYAGTGTINTSDAREKTSVVALTEPQIEASKQLARELGSFQFLSAVAAKGADARTHFGMTVQRAMEILQANGLNPTRYAFICHDVWPEEKIEHPAMTRQVPTGELDERGQPAMKEEITAPAWTETKPAADRYGFRTDELLLFIARGLDARLSALEAK